MPHHPGVKTLSDLEAAFLRTLNENRRLPRLPNPFTIGLKYCIEPYRKPRNAVALYKEKRGDCFDISALVVAWLERKGIASTYDFEPQRSGIIHVVVWYNRNDGRGWIRFDPSLAMGMHARKVCGQ